MKNIVLFQSLLMLAFFLSLPFTVVTQEEAKDKKVRVKTIKEVNGEKVVTDTTFYVSDEDDVKAVVRKMAPAADGDSTANVMIDVMVDVDKETEWTSDGNKKVVVVKKGDHDGDVDVRVEKKVIVIDGDGEEEVYVYPHGGQKKVMKFKSDDGEEEIIVVSPGSYHKVIKWKDEDGELHEFDFDFDFDTEALEKEMAELEDEMRELHIRIENKHGERIEEIIELEHLAELKHLEEMEHLRDMEVIVVPPAPGHFPQHEEFIWIEKSCGMEVTDEELREAGIKNKPDRLELDEIDVNKEDGVVDLSFTMQGDGDPRVTVYNIYGNKVFSGKPELMNSKYEIKMDLSKKQYGTYYMMIYSGNSSKTLRLKL